jgi:hypothetical protein
MTRDELVAQLKRLTIFGNLNEIELDGYVKVLGKRDLVDVRRAVDTIIATFVNRHYPFPAEISAFIRDAIKLRQEEEQRHKSCCKPDNIGSRLFYPALCLAWRLQPDRFRFWNKKITEEAPDPDKTDTATQDAYYQTVITAIQKERNNGR